MKAFLILVILGVVGWYGWQWYSDEPEELLVSEEAEVSAAPAGLGATMEARERRSENGRSGNGGSQAVESTSSSRSNGARVTLPPELQKLREAADARWASLRQADRNPVTDSQAIALARDYSRVLRGLYAIAGSRGEQERLIKDRLHPLAQAIFFSPAPYLDDETGFVVNYIVKPGDILDHIGREYGMSYQFINILRGSNPEDGNIRPGDRLKLFNLKESGYDMHISKSDFRMDLFIGGIFARRYDVGIGEDVTPTPAGTTHITAREKHPQWTDPVTNRVFDYGAPGHIIGPVWLAFDPKIGRNGLGIHGYTGDGQATGSRSSNGCVRMRNEEALELYRILVPCTTTRDGRFISRAPMRVTIID
ncbi:MAG: hypothetical protein EA402_11015 [Planctomycetota bacterium]|nr:MAG: hypothetical protein EA402_11015 [Planctomycetota bacterium]